MSFDGKSSCHLHLESVDTAGWRRERWPKILQGCSLPLGLVTDPTGIPWLRIPDVSDNVDSKMTDIPSKWVAWKRPVDKQVTEVRVLSKTAAGNDKKIGPSAR